MLLEISWTIEFFPLARPRESPGLPRRGFLFAKRRSVAGTLPRRAAPLFPAHSGRRPRGAHRRSGPPADRRRCGRRASPPAPPRRAARACAGAIRRGPAGSLNIDRLIFLIVFQKRAHLGRPGRANPLDPSADQGSVDRQDHGRESCVSRHARAGPHARRAGVLARARATRYRRGSVARASSGRRSRTRGIGATSPRRAAISPPGSPSGRANTQS